MKTIPLADGSGTFNLTLPVDYVKGLLLAKKGGSVNMQPIKVDDNTKHDIKVFVYFRNPQGESNGKRGTKLQSVTIE